jgi:ubiquinone/menaquinone biosynthesis C-methylase UbiE
MAETTSFFTDGEAYERLMGRWSRAAGDVFLEWLALPRELHWVDVGSGTGAFTELIIERCDPKQVDAIDPAEDQIAFARKRKAAERAAFRSGDAQALPYPDSAFDVAAMALVISFVPDPFKAVAEMKRVVKPGGTVATYMWDFSPRGYTQWPLIEALATVNVKVPPLPGYRNSLIDSLTGFFEAAGLTQIATRTIDIEVSYTNFDDYWSSQTGLPNPTVQSIRKMTDPDIERLRANLRATLPTDRTGRIAYPARANAIKGRVPE